MQLYTFLIFLNIKNLFSFSFFVYKLRNCGNGGWRSSILPNLLKDLTLSKLNYFFCSVDLKIQNLYYDHKEVFSDLIFF